MPANRQLGYGQKNWVFLNNLSLIWLFKVNIYVI